MTATFMFFQDETGTWRDKTTKRQVRVWQRFLSGRRLDLLAPSPLDFDDEDLALGLSRQARWNGQTRGEHAYSVAQHAVEVWRLICRSTPAPLLTMRLEIAALHHDDSEGLGFNDVITPLKPLLGPGYYQADARLQQIAFIKYGVGNLTATERKLLKRADRIMAATEAYQLAAYSIDEVRDPRILGNCQEPRRDIVIEPWLAEMARQQFLAAIASQRAKTVSTSDDGGVP